MPRLRAKGFTLVELMITVAILGVLVGIAYPSYVNHRLRTVRVQGEDCLLRIAGLQERYYGRNNAYTSLLTDLGVGSSDCGEGTGSGAVPYQVSIASAAAARFCLLATPQGNQLQDGVLAVQVDSSKLDPGQRLAKSRYPYKAGASATICGVSKSNTDSGAVSWSAP